MIEVELSSPQRIMEAMQKLETMYAEELEKNTDANDLHLIYEKIKYLRTKLALVPARRS